MALALLDPLGSDSRGARFRIDTGTSRYYQLKVGKARQRRAGLDWIDEVVYATPIAVNRAGGDLLGSSTSVRVPAKYFEGGRAYVQLFSFKTADGRSPAFSNVVLVPTFFEDGPLDIDISESLSQVTVMNRTQAFSLPRRVPHRGLYAQQASFGDILGEVVKIAGPIVANLLGGGAGGASAGAGAGATAGASAGAGGNGTADAIGRILQMIIGALQPAGAVNAGTPAGAAAGATPAAGTGATAAAGAATGTKSGSQSLSIMSNRFASAQTMLAHPFIFGVDDALIASLAGPILQVLPQLMNSVNQNRLQMKQQQNALITNLVNGVNQRMILDKLLEAQRAAPSTNPDLSQLIQLLQQTPAANGTAATQSLMFSVPDGTAAQVSARAVLSFITADPTNWNGAPLVLFTRTAPIQLKVKFTVGDPVPTRPLAKAIIRIVFKDKATETALYEKSFRQTNVTANSVLPLSFAVDELARLPINNPLAVLAELRWPGRAGTPARSALGSLDAVFIDRYFLKAQGQPTSDEIELTDMQRFRPFWNKVWEAPVLDLSQKATDDTKKYLWELNVSAKYTVLISPDQDANGLMETKLLQGKTDPDSLTQAVAGRMKAGIELSISELNKLLPLWNDRAPLDSDRLRAVTNATFAKNNGGEFIQNLKLKGKAGERGMVWVVPVFRLFGLTLATVQKTDDTGQVTETSDETIAFPLPVAARVIGLKSQQ